MTDGEFLWGITFALSVLGALSALPVTWLLLRRYRKSVIRYMSRRDAVGILEPPPASHTHRDPVSPDSAQITRGIRRDLSIVIVLGLLNGLAYATLFLEWNDLTSFHRLVFFTLIYSWVTVIGIWIVTRGRRRWVLGSTGVYLALLLIDDLIAGAPPFSSLRLWVWHLIPTAAVVVFLSRPLRGVGTLVLGAMMAAILGSQAFLLVLVGSEPLLLSWIQMFEAVGITDVGVTFWSIHVVGFLVSLAVAMPVVWLLSRWYARHGFSDQMLLIGSVFLVFALDSSLSVSSSDWTAFGFGMLIFVVVGLLALVSYRLLHRPPAPAHLLMLRVFSPYRGSQRLLDLISAQWRYLGPVRMIGGPDLAIASVEPDEFLTFVSGRLRRLFIDDPDALEKRMRTLVSRPDPDGRYRVEEFFCFDDTWRLTVTELLGHSDAVVMDLRGFGPDNQGCIDEIELLASQRVMGRTVLLVDSVTDRRLLDATLGPALAEDGPTVLMLSPDADPGPAMRSLISAASREAAAPDSRFTASD